MNLTQLWPDRSGQSAVIGVALLLGITVISMSVLTAGAGTLIERQAAQADATRVADQLDGALSPVEITGVRQERLSFTSGTLQPVDRQLRILDGSSVVRSVEMDGLVFTSGNRRVASVGGAIVRGSPGNAWLHSEPPITTAASSGNQSGVLFVGAPRIGSPGTVSGSGGVQTTIRTNVTHERERLGTGEYAVAIETETPGPFVRYYEKRNATVEMRDIDGDGIVSAVIRFEGDRTTYLVVHSLAVEVGNG